MSLGLGDLNKKRKTKTNSSKSSSPDAGSESSRSQGSWTKSRTARPWTSTGLQRSVRNRPRLNQGDAAVSAEWMHLHAGHLFNIDIPKDSRLMKLQAKLAAVEEQIHDSVCSTVRAIQSFCFGRNQK